MMELKAGTRLRSVTDTTEVIVVRPPSGSIDLRCGGHPMVPSDQAGEATTAIESGFGDGCLLGKRYADEETGLEVLCTKGGPGSLSLGDVVLLVKGAKPLPSSD
jgi:hypothetical protein